MSHRLGTRTPNGKITVRPARDVAGQPYRWQNVSVVPLTKTSFYVAPAGFKMTPELEAELQAEAAEIARAGTPTSEQMTEAALPEETPEPRATRRKPETKDS